MAKRSYKLQEFAAHTADVNCLKIGRKSSGVLVTGGDDKKVNMWAIGKPNAILSLSGHQSAVTCVAFDGDEEVVVAGAAGGTLKLWDLEEAKVVRTLTGHRSNCLSVDFHPFAEYLASGSLDTNLKIWDVRNRSCIHTYKAHTRGVTHVRFSPDGRWVTSGSEDGTVKLWDLTAGKILHEFCHTHPITGIDFHPKEYLLGTSSNDRTIRFWDLETFEGVDIVGPEALPARAICFHPDGSHILSAQQDGLRVYSWEPVKQHDWVDVAWSKVTDLTMHEGKLIGCSFHQSLVGVWIVDLTRTRPFGSHAQAASRSIDRKAEPSSSRALPEQSHVATSSPEGSGLSTTDKGEDTGNRAAPGHAQSKPRNQEAWNSRGRQDNRYNGHTGLSAHKAKDHARREAPSLSDDLTGAINHPPTEMVSIGTCIGDSLPLSGLDFAALNIQPIRGGLQSGSQPGAAGSIGMIPQSDSNFQVVANEPERCGAAHVSPVFPGPQPRGLDFDSFIPPTASAAASSSPSDITDEDVLGEVLGKHTKMTTILSTRSSNLQTVQGLWGKGDIHRAMAALKRCKDSSVAADVMASVSHQRNVFKLELCLEVCPVLQELLATTHEQWQHNAIDVAVSLTKTFGQMIRDTLNCASNIGVDVAMESRREKCEAARAGLKALIPRLTTVKAAGGELSRKAQGLLEELQAL